MNSFSFEQCSLLGTAEHFANWILGVSQEEANKRAKEHGWRINPVLVDGEPRLTTCDIQVNRVNVEIEESRIKRIINIG